MEWKGDTNTLKLNLSWRHYVFHFSRTKGTEKEKEGERVWQAQCTVLFACGIANVEAFSQKNLGLSQSGRHCVLRSSRISPTMMMALETHRVIHLYLILFLLLLLLRRETASSLSHSIQYCSSSSNHQLQIALSSSCAVPYRAVCRVVSVILWRQVLSPCNHHKPKAKVGPTKVPNAAAAAAV